MIHKHTRHLRDAFCAGGNDSAVSGDDVEVSVDDYGIDEAKLPDGRAQFVNLFRGVGPCVIYIRDEFLNGNEVHFRSCVHYSSVLGIRKPPGVTRTADLLNFVI